MNVPDPAMRPDAQREAALFQAAAQLTGQARKLFLDGACQGDSALRSHLEALLAAHEQPEGVLGAPVGRRDEFHESHTSAGKDPGPTELDPPTVPDETVDQMIGRYKILEKVGEGGCGVVYVAEQTEPVRRRVARKVIKRVDTRSSYRGVAMDIEDARSRAAGTRPGRLDFRRQMNGEG